MLQWQPTISVAINKYRPQHQTTCYIFHADYIQGKDMLHDWQITQHFSWLPPIPPLTYAVIEQPSFVLINSNVAGRMKWIGEAYVVVVVSVKQADIQARTASSLSNISILSCWLEFCWPACLLSVTSLLLKDTTYRTTSQYTRSGW